MAPGRRRWFHDCRKGFKHEIELTTHRQENLGRLVRAFVCDDEINEEADEAKVAVANASTSFESVVSAMESVGVPFKFRVFDTTCEFSSEQMRQNFRGPVS